MTIDKRTRRRIEELLNVSQPRYRPDPGSRVSLAEMFAGGPPEGLFPAANHMLALNYGVDLTRENPAYRSVEDVCSTAPVDLLVSFIECCWQYLGLTPEEATPIGQDRLETELNRILAEQEVPLRMHEGRIAVADADSYAPTHLEEKFGILLSPKRLEPDYGMLSSELFALQLSMGLLFVDVDEFKRLNQRFTEPVVDETILPDLQRLLRTVSAKRGRCYRHGGEEFVVLLPNHGVQEALAFSERLRRECEEHRFEVDGEIVAITLSIGAAIAPSHGTELPTLLKAASDAKRTAKETGRNRVVLFEH